MSTDTAAPLALSIGVRAFALAYSQVPSKTGQKSVREIAAVAGCTYLAAAERASKLCEAGRASLWGPMTDTRVSLH